MSKPMATVSPAVCRHHEWTESFLSSEPPSSLTMFLNTVLQAAAPTDDNSRCCHALHRCPSPGGAPTLQGLQMVAMPRTCLLLWRQPHPEVSGGLTPPSLRPLATADGHGHGL